MTDDNVSPEEILKRICKLALFGRNFLHLNFIELEKINPSFAMMAKICEMAALELRDELHKGVDHAEHLMTTMQDIAVAIVDRDNAVLVDSMAILDEFFELKDIKPHLVTS